MNLPPFFRFWLWITSIYTWIWNLLKRRQRRAQFIKRLRDLNREDKDKTE